MEKKLNFDYACIHGTYWMYYGVICSFASVFLLSRGYSNSEIGVVLAMGNILAVILQPLTADLADRSKKITLLGICQFVCLILAVMTVGMFLINSKSIVLLVLYVIMIALTTILQPLYNSLNFRLEDCGVQVNFGIGRSMGSLCYAVLCSFLGALIESRGDVVLPIAGELILIMLIVSMLLTKKRFFAIKGRNLQVTNKPIANKDPDGSEINLREFVSKNRKFFILNISILGIYFSNSIFNSYMMQIVANVGGNSDDMGKIFAVMAFLEIPTLCCFHWLRKRFACQQMLKVAAIAFTAKIGICYFATSVVGVYVSQSLQLISFALFLPAMVHFTDEVMSKGEAVKGQALFTIMVTISTVFGSLAGGIVLDRLGAKALIGISTLITALGAAVFIFYVDRIKAGSDVSQ